MATPYLSEIRLVSFNFPPRGWAFCNGQILSIAQNQALFSLLGTTYGGNGTTTFALPDLRARVPIHAGDSHNLGEVGGENAHTLAANEIPSHAHTMKCSSADVTDIGPGGKVLANVKNVTGIEQFAGTADVDMAPNTVAPAGGGQAHPNQQPYLVLNYVIALSGIFPSRNATQRSPR